MYAFSQNQGTVYEDVGEIPPDQLQLALKSVMETLAELHAIHWHPADNAQLYLPHENTQSFWKEEVCIGNCACW